MILFPGRHLMGVLKCHHISYFEKWKLWVMFFGRFLRWSNYDQKKKVQSSGRRLECLGAPWARIVSAGSLIKLQPEKRYSCLAIGCNVWGVGSMSSDCFGGFDRMFFGGFLDQITNYDRKKGYSSLAIGWSVSYLVWWTMLPSPIASSQYGTMVLRMGVVPPASSLLSKSIRKASITATCRLEWNYQSSKKIWHLV